VQKKEIAGLLSDLPTTGNPSDTNQVYQMDEGPAVSLE
jgi:hypothetical protein